MVTETEARDPKLIDPTAYPENPKTSVLKEFKDSEGNITGRIQIQLGADGAWLQFDCECTDALPYCQAQCCALRGTVVHDFEVDEINYPVEFDTLLNALVMQRSADGFCACLDRSTRLCSIYEDRPRTCRTFHCTRGADVRGWKLANAVARQSMS